MPTHPWALCVFTCARVLVVFSVLIRTRCVAVSVCDPWYVSTCVGLQVFTLNMSEDDKWVLELLPHRSRILLLLRWVHLAVVLHWPRIAPLDGWEVFCTRCRPPPPSIGSV
jgi:hypothetical protein